MLVEGKHLVPCHKFVLDACSDYFASFLKEKLLEDKNLVICLPKEIKLWEVQALLQFMYHGEVCISQEGLSSLVKCAELLQVKGLCGNETTSIISKDKEPSTQPKSKLNEGNNDDMEQSALECPTSNTTSEMIEVDPNESVDYNDQMIIKREINISKLRIHSDDLMVQFLVSFFQGDVDVDSSNVDDITPETGKKKSSQSSSPQAVGLIRVKRNLFEHHNDKEVIKNSDEASNSLVYNKKSMDIYVKPTSKNSEMDGSSRGSTPLLIEQDQDFENIVCSPTLIQYHYLTDKPSDASQSDVTSGNIPEGMEEYDDDDDDDLFIEEANVCSNDALYNMITQKFENCETFSKSGENDSELRRKLMISSVGSLNHQYVDSDNSKIAHGSDQSNEMKVAIGGLYLRNPRGLHIYFKT